MNITCYQRITDIVLYVKGAYLLSESANLLKIPRRSFLAYFAIKFKLSCLWQNGSRCSLYTLVAHWKISILPWWNLCATGPQGMVGMWAGPGPIQHIKQRHIEPVCQVELVFPLCAGLWASSLGQSWAHSIPRPLKDVGWARAKWAGLMCWGFFLQPFSFNTKGKEWIEELDLGIWIHFLKGSKF